MGYAETFILLYVFALWLIFCIRGFELLVNAVKGQTPVSIAEQYERALWI